MKRKNKTIALALGTILCLSITGCSNATPPSGAASGSEPISYSTGLSDNGFYTDIRALDYIQLPEDYKSVRIPDEYTDISEELIDNDLHDMMVNLGLTVEVTDRPVQSGDVVNIDFVGTINGVEFEGGSSSDYSVQLGVGNLLSDYEDQLIGRQAGDSFDATIVFPNGYGTSTDSEGNPIDLSNQTATFHTTINSIGIYALKDEDVAEAFQDNYKLNDGSLVDTVEKARLYFEEYEQYRSVTTYLADYLLSNSSIIQEIPENIFEHERQMEQVYAENLAEQYGMPLEDFLATGGYDSMEEYLDASTEYIHQDVVFCFIIQAIAEDLNIWVTEADIEDLYRAGSGMNIETYGKGFVSQQVLASKVMEQLADIYNS